jgi:hypothetical protein
MMGDPGEQKSFFFLKGGKRKKKRTENPLERRSTPGKKDHATPRTGSQGFWR